MNNTTDIRKARLEALKKERINSQKDNVKLVEVKSTSSGKSGGGGVGKKTVASHIALERKAKKIEEIEKKLEEKDMPKIEVDRRNNLEYSISDVERWSAIQEDKEEKRSNSMIDFQQKQAKKYKRTISEFTPNLAEYQRQKEDLSHDDFYRDANSLAFVTAASATTTQRGIDKLANEIEAQAKKRKEFSRRRTHDDEADVTFINERNMRFNKKISRAFDKYTKDIKDSFERGTAL